MRLKHKWNDWLAISVGWIAVVYLSAVMGWLVLFKIMPEAVNLLRLFLFRRFHF